MVAVVPSSLIERYERRHMASRLYSINHFKIVCIPPDDLPKYEGYTIVDDHYVIVVNQATQFTPLQPNLQNNFPTYPLVSTIESLVRNSRRQIFIGKF